MNGDQAIGLIILLSAACLILWWAWTRPSDYQDIEHRKETMHVLEQMHDKGTHHDEGNDDGNQQIPGVQR